MVDTCRTALSENTWRAAAITCLSYLWEDASWEPAFKAAIIDLCRDIAIDAATAELVLVPIATCVVPCLHSAAMENYEPRAAI